ncbi:MAG TPA: ABC transporter substrate-binding protein [Burkholderiales bacterium]|jgi:putative tryptophan/tyrosine transport system substrate-binding protein|nr:ABC transporter substrate-binding protein [Burkholderiales bacterium]
MLRAVLVASLILGLLVPPRAVEAQQARVYRVGVILHGGSYSAALDGLRDGLKELGFEEGKQFVFHLRDTKGDLKAVEAAAKNLEAERVDLIYAVATSVTLATKTATKAVPIVFYAGTDPVAFGLIESYRKPGGRLTGVHGQFTDLTAKRMQLLQEIVPKLRRVVTFYNPDNPAARESMKFGREAARRLKIEIVERPVASVEELRTGLRALRTGEADAIFYVADAMVTSQSEMVIDNAMAKGLPTMYADRESVTRGALASYGLSYYAFGRSSAKKVHRVLLGAHPGELPIEQMDRPYLVINLKTAKALGLVIPEPVLARADEIIR